MDISIHTHHHLLWKEENNGDSTNVTPLSTESNYGYFRRKRLAEVRGVKEGQGGRQRLAIQDQTGPSLSTAKPITEPPRLILDRVIATIRFVRLAQILPVLPIGKSLWWAGVRSGRLPRPTKLGSRISVSHASEIRALLATIAVGKTTSEAPKA